MPKPIVTYAESLRRRREAALRLPPLESGQRDPWPPEERPGPCSYLMTPAALAAELARLEDWQDWEVAARLGLPETA